MGIHITDTGIKFTSTGRIAGKYSGQIGAFVVGEMWGCVTEDGRLVWFLRPLSELNETERNELADYAIAQWTRLKDQSRKNL